MPVRLAVCHTICLTFFLTGWNSGDSNSHGLPQRAPLQRSGALRPSAWPRPAVSAPIHPHFLELRLQVCEDVCSKKLLILNVTNLPIEVQAPKPYWATPRAILSFTFLPQVVDKFTSPKKSSLEEQTSLFSPWGGGHRIEHPPSSLCVLA